MSLKYNLLAELARGPRSAKQLRKSLRADNKKITQILISLTNEGKVKTEKGLYSLDGPKEEPIPCQLVKLGKAFGFAAALDGSGDVFIPGHSLMGALPKEEVMVMLSKYPRREDSREGEIISIIKPVEKIVGTVEKWNGKLVLVPDNAPDTPLVIRKSADGGAKVGEKAAGVLLERGSHHEDHQIGITLRFGSADSARQCAKAILYGEGIEKSFPSDVKAQVKKMDTEVISKEEIAKRVDLRKEIIFTIDSASTKDIDDAISLVPTDNGYQLGVHIADVSHYVTPKCALDEEAFSRGTSIYYAESVIPMLPRQLSNGICSLNPGEDRLAFSSIITLDHDGTMLDYRFAKSVIRSRIKGVYSEINSIFQKEATPEIEEKYEDVAGTLALMHELYGKLVLLRSSRGSMEIESDESKLVLDEEGRCIDIKRAQRGDSEKMIEEFMLLANTAAAHNARRNEIPFVYRVHDEPGAERVENLKKLLTAAGVSYDFAGPIPTQKELGKLLDATRGTNLERPVHTGVLRSMAKAAYEPLPKGHYGLALKDYAHFTSPIRRYPDLAIHRILTDLVGGMSKEAIGKKYKTFAEVASSQSSQRELVAQHIERDCDDCYKAEYMQQHIGEVFDGVISSVVQYGLYVELKNSVEGLVHISHLSTNAMTLVEGISLTDTFSGKSYRLGDSISVRVAGVDISQGNIDFVPE